MPGFTETKLCQIHFISFFMGLFYVLIMYLFIYIYSYTTHLLHNYCVLGAVVAMKIDKFQVGETDTNA